jgi:hypothetical protein
MDSGLFRRGTVASARMLTRLAVFAFAALLYVPAARAQNPYDTFGKVLMPFVGLLAEKGEGDRALALSLRVEEATGVPPELAAAQADFAVQFPDRVKLSAPLFGNRVTLCRRGDVVWVSPGSAVKALLQNPEIAARLPEPNREFKMKPFKLPIPAKQLVFLPALFKVRDAGAATIDGRTYDGVEFNLMPQLAKSLKVEDWSGAVWVDEKTRPVRLKITRPETQVTVRFDKVQFAKALPPETWAPTKEEEADTLIVPPARYDQLMRAMFGERAEGTRKKR